MSATVASARWQSAMERVRCNGGTQHTARVTQSGQVVLTTIVLTARGNHRGETELWPRRVEQRVLGVVDRFDPGAWRDAETLLQHHGYRPLGDWTTVDSDPAVLLRFGR